MYMVKDAHQELCISATYVDYHALSERITTLARETGVRLDEIEGTISGASTDENHHVAVKVRVSGRIGKVAEFTSQLSATEREKFLGATISDLGLPEELSDWLSERWGITTVAELVERTLREIKSTEGLPRRKAEVLIGTLCAYLRMHGLGFRDTPEEEMEQEVRQMQRRGAPTVIEASSLGEVIGHILSQR